MRYLRALLVGLLLVVAYNAKPAAFDGCDEYMCKIVVGGGGGGGFYCINEGEFDCQCSYFDCFCGYCFCSDNGDCWLMPSIG